MPTNRKQHIVDSSVMLPFLGVLPVLIATILGVVNPRFVVFAHGNWAILVNNDYLLNMWVGLPLCLVFIFLFAIRLSNPNPKLLSFVTVVFLAQFVFVIATAFVFGLSVFDACEDPLPRIYFWLLISGFVIQSIDIVMFSHVHE